MTLEPDPQMPQTHTQTLLDANESFYRAMRSGDLAAMNALWSRDRRVSCTHPDGPALFGREAVMESWRILFARPVPLHIHGVDACVTVTGRTAMILCRETVGHIDLIASNIFVNEAGAWRMTNHQAAIVRGATAI